METESQVYQGELENKFGEHYAIAIYHVYTEIAQDEGRVQAYKQEFRGMRFLACLCTVTEQGWRQNLHAYAFDDTGEVIPKSPFCQLQAKQ